MNLPYSAESSESGTAEDTVNVLLRQRLNSSTVYYYTVSAVNGDVTVTVQGTFTTPQYGMCNVHLCMMLLISVFEVHYILPIYDNNST